MPKINVSAFSNKENFLTKIEDSLLHKYIAIKVILGHFHFKVHKIIIRIHKGNLLCKTLANGIENIAESKLIGSVQESKIFFNLSEIFY